MNKSEFELMIISRSFINASLSDMQTEVNNIGDYLSTTLPYSKDNELIELLNNLTKNIDTSSEKNFSTLLHNSSDSQLAHQENIRTDLTSLSNYFNQLAKTGLDNPPTYQKYLSQQTIHNIQLNQDINFIKNQNVQTISQADTLMKNNFTRYIQIRGDGNCYYRSVMLGFMLQAITSGEEIRRERFNHLAELIEHTDIPHVKSGTDIKDLAYPNQASQQQALKDLANLFRQAAENKAIQSTQDLFNRFAERDNQFDKSLIVMSRGLTAAALTKKITANELYNEMTIRDAVMFTYELTPEDFASEYILTMGTDAEGAPVNLGFLPEQLGLESTIHIVSNNNINEAVVVVQPEIRTSSNNEAINLMLRPGHYDLLLTESQHDAIKKHELAYAQNILRSKTPLETSNISTTSLEEHNNFNNAELEAKLGKDNITYDDDTQLNTAISESIMTYNEEQLNAAIQESLITYDEDEQLRAAINESIATYNEEQLNAAIRESLVTYDEDEQLAAAIHASLDQANSKEICHDLKTRLAQQKEPSEELDVIQPKIGS